jgi:hypothetical protein
MSLVLAGLGGDELVTLGLTEFVPYAPSEDSYKDLFEADVFRPRLFASGVWRGQGGTMTPLVFLDIEGPSTASYGVEGPSTVLYVMAGCNGNANYALN